MYAVRCLLFAVCGSLIIVGYCSLFAVRCLLSVSLFGVVCWLCIVMCCSLFVVCFSLFDVCCRLLCVSLFVMCC